MSKFIDQIEEKIEAVEQSSHEIGVQSLQEAQGIIEEAKQKVIRLLQMVPEEAGANRVVLMRSRTDMIVYLRNEMNNIVREFILGQIDDTLAFENIYPIFETIIMYRLITEQIDPDIHIVLNKNDFEKLKIKFLLSYSGK